MEEDHRARGEMRKPCIKIGPNGPVVMCAVEKQHPHGCFGPRAACFGTQAPNEGNGACERADIGLKARERVRSASPPEVIEGIDRHHLDTRRCGRCQDHRGTAVMTPNLDDSLVVLDTRGSVEQAFGPAPS